MKVAVVGCGAVGSYYGGQLARAGLEVHFLLRSDHDVVRRQGVRLLSPVGDFTAQPRCARMPQQIGVCDLVLVALKTTANDQFPHLLPPLVGEGTAVLTLQNGLGNDEQLARLFPPRQITVPVLLDGADVHQTGRTAHRHGIVQPVLGGSSDLQSHQQAAV